MARPAPPPAPLVDKDLRYVKVFYGTNRARTDACVDLHSTSWDTAVPCAPNLFYGGAPAPVADATAGGGLEVGTLNVTFPPLHTPGKIERPAQIFSFTLRAEDPDKDVLISEIRSFSDDYEGWTGEVRNTRRKQAFIYVHGYATTFAQAARRTAQVAYDLDFDLEKDFRGLPMMYSWPARGETTAYLADYDASFEAVDTFNQFLDLVKFRAGVERVHVIAHSMGNRLVANALASRSDAPQQIIDQLVLAAPDIWASRFKRRFLRTLPGLAQRVTLYVSDKDRALIASSEIREDEPRAGQVRGGLLEASAGVERFDAVDASNLETDFLGHSYYANNNSMLSDIYCLLKGTPAESRPLLMLTGVAWQFIPLGQLVGLDAGVCQAPISPVGPERGGRWWIWFLLAGLLLMFLVFVLRRRAES